MTAINIAMIALVVAVFLEIWERDKLPATAWFNRLTRRWRRQRNHQKGWHK